MKCAMCPNPKDLQPKFINHRYRESGLDNVILRGVAHFRCGQCGEEYYGFGDLEQLHNLIAKALVMKPSPLTGKELKFLRKRLGLSGAELARRIDIAHETLSRYENGKLSTPRSVELLVRYMCATRFPDRAYDLHDLVLHKKSAHQNIEIKAANDGRWDLVSAA